MATSFYFYDLETSAISPRTGRIMQFAGQRTDMKLKPIGEADNILVKLTDDVLPEPDAVLVTGITPQATLADGVTEAEFMKIFHKFIATPGTIFVGYNSVRFDDEFIRYTSYRNFYDPYEWAWSEDRSRWDILDVLRMMRALRPDHIKWPFTPDGKPTNRLELLTKLNGLEHEHAHDALSDVHATIAVARMIWNKQPKLFDYLLSMRDKNKVNELVLGGQPFVYSSGRISSEYEKTTISVSLGERPDKQGILVYDLHADPAMVAGKSPEEIAQWWNEWPDDPTQRFPVKTLKSNRCPAVAPIGVMDDASWKRIKLDMETVQKHLAALKKMPEFYKNTIAALKLLDKDRQARFITDAQDVDAQLYDGFFAQSDKTAMSVVRAADPSDIAGLSVEFNDERLKKMLPLYKARNFRQHLSPSDVAEWEKFKYNKLMSSGDKSIAARYFNRLGELAQKPDLTPEQQFLLEELQLYGQSILPELNDADEYDE